MSKSSWRPAEWASALCCFVLAGIACTWPLITRFSTDLPGDFHKDGLEDAYQNVWNLWWMVKALSQLRNPFITDRFFFPESPNLFYHTLSPINILLAAPVTAVWGPIAGFNTVVMLSFALGGLGMWALARERVGHGPALLAGLAFVASPFHMASIVSDGQLQIFALQWLPWYILFLLRALRTGNRRTIFLAGFFLTLTAWTDWYYTLFLLIFTAGVAVWELRPQRSGARAELGHGYRAAVRRIAVALLGIGAISAVGAAPLVVPMLIEAMRHTYMNIYPADDPARLSVDLLAFLVPPRGHAIWGRAPWSWGVAQNVNRRFYLGLIILALALLAMFRRSAARPWGLMALTFGLLALGAELRVNRVDTGVPLPYALLANLPVVRLSRQPDRFDVLVTIAMALLAAHGAAALLEWLGAQRRSWRPAVLTGLIALVLIDFMPAPILTRAPKVPPFLASLPHTDDGALLEFPFHEDVPYRDAERMLFQTIHSRPISGGYHSRLYPQFQLGLPVLRDLQAGAMYADIIDNPKSWAAALRTIGYRYIIGYKQQPLGPQNLKPEEEAPFRALVEAGLGVDAPIYEDGWLIAYEVPEASPTTMIQIRSGWGDVERPADAPAYRWVGQSAELGLFTPKAGSYLLSFSAQPADDGPRTLRLDLPGGSSQIAVVKGRHRYTLLLNLPVGCTKVELDSVEPPTSGDAIEGNGDTRPISVRISEIALKPLRRP